MSDTPKPGLRLSLFSRLSSSSSSIPKLQTDMPPSSHHSLNALTTSARVAEAEKTIHFLEEENSSLRKELTDIRALYQQLLTEGKHESFDERRVLLLKSQVIQLERQLIMLSGSQSNVSSTLIDVENSVSAVIDFCQSLLQSKTGCREAKLSYDDLNRVIGTLTSARNKLFKNADATSSENQYARPLVFIGDFLKNCAHAKQATMFDVCRGTLDHINLKEVGRLEARLVQLYKQLMLLSKTLSFSIYSIPVATGLPDLPTAVYSRLFGQVKKSCDLLEGACSDLLQLSLLVPAAPLPLVNKPLLKGVTVDNVMNSLHIKNTARLRDIRPVIEALLKAMNYSVNIAHAERNVLLNELEFHREIYDHQSNYVDSLMTSLDNSYSEFEAGICSSVMEPLSNIMASFKKLKETLNHDALLDFVALIDKCTPDLNKILNKLGCAGTCSVNQDRYYAQYQTHISNALETCRKNRNKLIDETVQAQSQLHELHVTELSQILDKEDREQSSTLLSATATRDISAASSSKCVDTGECTYRTDTSDCTLSQRNHVRNDQLLTANREDTKLAKTSMDTKRFERTMPRLSSGKLRGLPAPGVAQQKLALKLSDDSCRKKSRDSFTTVDLCEDRSSRRNDSDSVDLQRPVEMNHEVMMCSKTDSAWQRPPKGSSSKMDVAVTSEPLAGDRRSSSVQSFPLRSSVSRQCNK